jgi:hypothetical protein
LEQGGIAALSLFLVLFPGESFFLTVHLADFLFAHRRCGDRLMDGIVVLRGAASQKSRRAATLIVGSGGKNWDR